MLGFLPMLGAERIITGMPARAMGSGTIAFGLVSIPVKLFTSSATSNAISFNQIHKTCGSRVRQQLVCAKEDVVVGRDEIVKGYEFAKDQYVLFTEEELKTLEEQGTGGIDIAEFVPLDSVDPVYFDKAYYLGPDKGAGRAYHLLRNAMKDTGLCAIASYAARGKQYLVLLRPVEDGIVMQQLHYQHELRAFSEVDIDKTTVKESELDLAIRLIKQAAGKRFSPERYKDEVRARIEALIERKIEGEDITEAPKETPRAQVIDLMSALKASLGEAKAAGAESNGGTKRSHDGRAAKDEHAGERHGPKRAKSAARAGDKATNRKSARGRS